MGRSRKRRSGGPLSDQELRRYGLFLTVPLIILVLAGVLLAAGLIRERGHGPKSEPETVDNLDSIGEEQDVVIEPDTKEYHYNFGGSILEKDAHHEINQLMEEQREQVIVILAGYPNEMRDFVRHNPGLTGRIGFEIEFDEYSPDQLLRIFKKMAQERRFEVDEAALNILEDKMPSIMALEDFASARTMRKILDHTVVKKASGLLDHMIREEDVASALKDKDFRLASKQPIGFTF